MPQKKVEWDLTERESFWGDIYFGGNVKASVVYDTGSDWIAVEGGDCTTCYGVYRPSKSEGNPRRVYNRDYVYRTYGSKTHGGDEYLDTVCFNEDSSSCVEDFMFWVTEKRIFSENGGPSGLLGLSRNHPTYVLESTTNRTGPLLTEKAAKEGVISANKFSFYLR